MRVLIAVLFVFFSAIEVSPEIVSVCAAGPIDDREVQVWLDATHGGKDECSQAIEEIAVAKLLARDALRRKVDEDPVVARKLRMIDAAAWRETAKRAIETAVAPPSHEEVAAMVVQRGRSFQQPARVRLRWIYHRAAGDDANARNEARVFLEDLRKRILEGAISFEEAARLHSRSESRYRDGFAGSVTAADVSPELAEVIFALADGEMTQVISNSTGHHLFRVDMHIPARYSTDLEKSQRARELLEKQKREKSWEAFLENILRTATPVISLENLTSDDENATVLELATGERLTAAQTLDLGKLPPEKAEKRLTDMALLIRLPEVAEKLGFEPDDDIRIEFDLRRTRKLATVFMEQLERQEVGPPTEKEIETEWLVDRPKYRSQARFLLWRAHLDLRIDDPLVQANRLRDSIRASESELTTVGDIEATETWFDNKSLIEMGPVAARVIRTTEDSAVLGPFRHGNDLWLIRILKRSEGQMQPLDKISARIARDLESSARKAVFSRIYDEQVAKAELKHLKDPSCTPGSRNSGPEIRSLN